jgi:hypothetical protein
MNVRRNWRRKRKNRRKRMQWNKRIKEIGRGGTNERRKGNRERGYTAE